MIYSDLISKGTALITILRTSIKIIIGFVVVAVIAGCVAQQSGKPPYPSVYGKGAINPHIVSLARIQQPNISLPQSTSLTAWNAYLQKNFLRPKEIDHQEMASMPQDPNHMQMTPLFDALGMIRDIQPSCTEYDYIFVFGGTPKYTYERFKFLQKNIKDKKLDISSNAKVVYINGYRKISDAEIEEAKTLGVKCTYQHQCAEGFWKAHYSDVPIKLEVITIQPPTGRRANTEDTLKVFYARLPVRPSTKILGYSNQPYVPYQGDTATAVSIKENRQDIDVEVVGGRSSTPVPTITYLDSIARRVFTAATLQP